jgi:hypothetical protein
MTISDLFESLLLKPEFYLNAVSVSRLWAYIMGYTAALREAGIQVDDTEFQKFCRWVDDKYGFRTTNSCAGIVLFKSRSDEFHAMERMKALWTQFRQKPEDRESSEND